MLVYGRNVLKEIDAKRIKKVFLGDNVHDKEIMNLLKDKNLKYHVMKKNDLDKMVKGNHQGIVLDILEYDYYQLKDILDEDFIIVLDHLEDVHNFGAIIRTMEAAGVKSVIIPKDRSVKVNDTVVKTSVGAIDRVKVVMVNNIAETLKSLQKLNYFIYGAFMDGEDYRNIDFQGKKVLVIGNEGKGISEIVKKNIDFKIGIPMKGMVNSLNASVAAGILIFKMIGG